MASGSPSCGQQNAAGARESRHVPQAVSRAPQSQPWERGAPASGSPRCRSAGCKRVGRNRGKGLAAGQQRRAGLAGEQDRRPAFSLCSGELAGAWAGLGE